MNNVRCVTEKRSEINFSGADSCTCEKADKQIQAFKPARAIISFNLIGITTIAFESLTGF